MGRSLRRVLCRRPRDRGAGQPQLPGGRCPRGRGRGPTAGHRPGHRRGRAARGADHRRRRDPRPQRLRHRRPGARPPHRRALPGAGRGGGGVRAGGGGRRGRGAGRRGPGAARGGHARSHPAPHLVRPRGVGPGGGRLHRWLAADRRRGPAGPGRAPADRGTGPRAARLRAPPRGPAGRRGGRVADARIRQLLLLLPGRRRAQHHRRREGGQPGTRAGRGDLRGGVAGVTGRRARLLRAHGSGERGRARPRGPDRAPPCRRRRDRPAAGRR